VKTWMPLLHTGNKARDYAMPVVRHELWVKNPTVPEKNDPGGRIPKPPTSAGKHDRIPVRYKISYASAEDLKAHYLVEHKFGWGIHRDQESDDSGGAV